MTRRRFVRLTRMDEYLHPFAAQTEVPAQSSRPARPAVGVRSTELTRRWRRRSQLTGVPVDPMWPTRAQAELSRSMIDGRGLAAAAATFGADRAGWLTEEEVTADVRAALDALRSMHLEPLDQHRVEAWVTQAYNRECEASRVAGLVVDALSGLDTEEAFLIHLWDLVREHPEAQLVVSVPPVDGPLEGRLSRPILLGRELSRSGGLVATVILDSGEVVGCTRTQADAERAARRLAELAPDSRITRHAYPAGPRSTIVFGRWYTEAVAAPPKG